MDKEKAKGLLLFFVKRRITSLAREQIIILENLKNEYQITEDIHSKNRKRVLDLANDSIREIEETLNALEINIKA